MFIREISIAGILRLQGAVFLLAVLAGPAAAGEYVEASIESKIVPGPIEFAVLLPDGYDDSADPYPLLLNLHGGGGNRNVLRGEQPIFEEMWQEESLLKLVIVTPSVTPRCFYMDYRDLRCQNAGHGRQPTE